MALEAIGAILAQPEFELTPQPAGCRRIAITGKRRAHNSILRQASEANGYRRPPRPKVAGYLRKLARYGFEPKHTILALIDALLADEFASQAAFAREHKLNVDTVRSWLDQLEARGLVNREDRRGGNRALVITIDRARLWSYRQEIKYGPRTTAGGFARRAASWFNRNPDPKVGVGSPLNPSKKIRSASSGLRPDGSLRELKEPKSAPTMPELRDKWRRVMRSCNAASRTRGAIGCFREAAWLRGKPFEQSVKLAQAASLEAWSIRTASRRDAWLRAVMARILADHGNLPSSFAALRFWLRQAEQWVEARHTESPR